MYITKYKTLADQRYRACALAAIAATSVFFSGQSSAGTATAPSTGITADGGQYHGQLLDGKLQGLGKIEWANGSRYEGNFENGLFSGTGKYTWSDGSTYEGHFVKGQFEGTGKWTDKEYQYTGEFKQGKYAGKGEITYQDGRKFKGEFANGKYQGNGRYEVSNGDFYAGEFDKGEFTGHGIYQSKSGPRLAGIFKKWTPAGPGRLTDAAGNIYEGSFADGNLHGPGRYIGKDGSRYLGEFKDGKYEGLGIYRNAKGDEYKGEFSYGMYDGAGILTYAAPQKDGRSKDSGIWRYGDLENKEAEKQARLNTETAIYQQRGVLDKTLAAVLPRAPDKINMYLLAVGGDGSQEVFHRETEFVRKQFDHDYGTQGRSLILVNSRNTVSSEPMATVTSIRESLAVIASRMDKEKDILFLYLTSHGSQDHQLSLKQNGMQLRNLQAKELGKLLAESGIRWKVVVVSACYAGGFIDPLKDERTLVITAARRDRTSFGCADENDFTYFGKAFFQKSLPGSETFTEAFDKAKALVAIWENDDFKTEGKKGEVIHSEPQIHRAPLIEEYLKKWRAQIKTAAPASSATEPASSPIT